MNKKYTAADLEITTLGVCKVKSPLLDDTTDPKFCPGFIEDNHDRVLLFDNVSDIRKRQRAGEGLPTLEIAGPRRRIYFDPPTVRAAIVTCGGLCPGINNVIRAIVMEAHYRYRVERIFGIRFGYEGLNPACGHEPIELTPEVVSTIHHFGGSFLGTSRGKQDVVIMADRLEQLGVNILFVVGGDGSQRGAHDISIEFQRRGKSVAVVGVPKTIDNDLMFMDKSFGYETAFAVAVQAVTCAHTEALGSPNGLGLVKVMGRDSGFIASATALATGEVNYVLIPEVPFTLEGEKGLLEAICHRLQSRGHAVLVVAEGAGQNLFKEAEVGTDASGNQKYGDIGQLLRDRIVEYFKERKIELNLKYIDPSYIIRSVPASATDSLFCVQLGRLAVHAAMAGRTGIVVARWHQSYVHLPIPLSASGRRKVDPKSDFWLAVLEATGQSTQYA